MWDKRSLTTSLKPLPSPLKDAVGQAGSLVDPSTQAGPLLSPRPHPRKKLSNFLHTQQWKGASNYVAKRYIESVDRDVYFEDVRLQMEAKLWGEEYNRHKPPKQVCGTPPCHLPTQGGQGWRLKTKATVVPVMVPFKVLTAASNSRHILSTIHYMQSHIFLKRSSEVV